MYIDKKYINLLIYDHYVDVYKSIPFKKVYQKITSTRYIKISTFN